MALVTTLSLKGKKSVGRVYAGRRLVCIARGSELYVQAATECFCGLWRLDDELEAAE